MRLSLKQVLGTAAVAAGLLLTACANNSNVQQEKQSEPVADNNDDYYEAYHEGRLYVFDDADTYKAFLEQGETPYRKVRIGEGPNSETVVFGLTVKDKKKTSGIASIDIYDGKLKPAHNFYGEIYQHGRIYVFDRWEDLQAVRELGHPSYMYTAIGAGPKGETLVFVLNSENKKRKPLELIARYNKLH